MGKVHSVAESLAESLGVNALVTKPLSTTRFIASTIASFKTILKWYKPYVEALYEYGSMKHCRGYLFRR